jgi:hypothetical protein
MKPKTPADRIAQLEGALLQMLTIFSDDADVLSLVVGPKQSLSKARAKVHAKCVKVYDASRKVGAKGERA